MTRTIYQSPPSAVGRAAGWVITQDFLISANPRLVRFRRHNGLRTLLNRVALWQPEPPWWDTRRWVPSERTVPLSILDIVHQHMKEHGGS